MMFERSSLDNVEWGEFTIQNVFDEVHSSPYSLDYSHIDSKYTDKEEIAYVTRSALNNGISQFIGDMTEDGKAPIGGTCLTIGLDTATVNFQETDFYTGQNVHIVRDKHLNRYTSLFIIPFIKQSLEKFSWGGYSATLGRFKKTRVLLPVKYNEPDWKLMEEFMQKVEKEIIPKIDFIPHIITDKRELDTIEWGEFRFDKVFTKIRRGKRLTKKNQIKGSIPYISSTGLNNGVDNFISNNENVRKYEGCLTIANSGSVGACFYHQYTFVASDHVTHLKNPRFEKYVYLFIASIAQRLQVKYSFNREINDQRIKKEKLFLPIKIDGSPDWNFMEQYMMRMENQLMKDNFDMN